jgi:hypothetical protein
MNISFHQNQETNHLEIFNKLSGVSVYTHTKLLPISFNKFWNSLLCLKVRFSVKTFPIFPKVLFEISVMLYIIHHVSHLIHNRYKMAPIHPKSRLWLLELMLYTFQLFYNTYNGIIETKRSRYPDGNENEPLQKGEDCTWTAEKAVLKTNFSAP